MYYGNNREGVDKVLLGRWNFCLVFEGERWGEFFYIKKIGKEFFGERG